ncbi:MAG: hypothetical protein A3F70_15470 [Acidobacteria bacterium RIFCSPLOWO2_12_FULL_67_14]|nr:MAG: hypothetical protein A3H29_13910 [Acidobacteria bacterium RIFCSPLOWO2_02_FULL_67_21]OFW38525.1 MAG: hypothetical protein A3F70_15470 [Acidobacteria bacterium RIFCSPLOWO2_12_FULL_67_14]
MSSTGLSSRTAATLAYSGWWVTGAIFWLLEREDAAVRFHAAQALVVFGAAALVVVLLGTLAVIALAFVPAAFGALAAAAAAAWTASVAVWAVTMWKVARGDEWRIPIAARWTERIL